ncbi:MAG: sugar phosphate nucleotidyltransferase [Alphaproteobacteria bacterium]
MADPVTTAMPDEAIVLAGGLGTRLAPVLPGRPKALAPVAGRPFLHWLLDRLAREGIGRVVLATGHLAGAIRDAVGDRHAGMAVEHAPEDRPLGTGGALWAALARCRGPRVFAMNGDTWSGTALAPMAAAAPAADIVMAVRPVADRARYGSVVLAGDRVVGLEEKGRTGPGLVSTGLYLLRRDLPGRCPVAAPFSLEREIIARPHGLDIRAWHDEAAFIDIGTPEDLARAQAALPSWAEAGTPADATPP